MHASEVGWESGWARDIESAASTQAFAAPWVMVGLALGAPHEVAFRFDGGPTHRALTAEARDYCKAPHEWRSLYRDSLARALVAQLTAGRPLLEGAAPGASRQRLGRERLRRTIDYIEAHLDAPLDLAALAAVAGLSTFHFTRVFRDAIGQTPARYVAARRMQRAEDLLAEGRLAHDEIARRCGMGEARHLRAALRRRLGTTPLSALD